MDHTEHPKDDIHEFSFGKKRKKINNEVSKEGKRSSDPPMDLYEYEFLLKRIYSSMEESGVDQRREKVSMSSPTAYRDGTKKTVWSNFSETCKIMNRSTDHVSAFITSETGTSGSITGNGGFTIRGVFQTKHIESMLKKYIRE